MEEKHDDEPLHSRSTVQFQMPHFVLGGTPHLAHGGGAEALPGMYGQGPQAWTDYDKYWCTHPRLSVSFFLTEVAGMTRAISQLPQKTLRLRRPWERLPRRVLLRQAVPIWLLARSNSTPRQL